MQMNKVKKIPEIFRCLTLIINDMTKLKKITHVAGISNINESAYSNFEAVLVSKKTKVIINQIENPKIKRMVGEKVFT
jgi:hypothetical protein